MYYRLLAYTDSTNDYGPFILYFAEALYDAYVEAHKVFSEKDRLRNADEVSRTLVTLAKSEGPFSLHRAAECIPSVHENTLRSRLNSLIDQGIVRREGKGRSIVYSFDDPLVEVRARVKDFRLEITDRVEPYAD